MELENGSGALTDSAVSPELERLLVENSKLKYQITHLKRVCDISHHGMSVIITVACCSHSSIALLLLLKHGSRD